MRVLVTGASGFVGRTLVEHLAEMGEFVVRGGYRSPPASVPRDRVETCCMGDIGSCTDWDSALDGVDVVVHCAARVHIMKETNGDPLPLYRESNVTGTLRLARAAAAGGCRRFIFVSSVKVNGEETLPGSPFTEEMLPVPADPYGISKLEAELGLREIARQTGMEVVVVRPPLVYGPGVKANFAAMVRLLEKGVPLPLGGIKNNQRSLVALDNLVDFLRTCIAHPAAANQTFLVSDGEDISTTELLRRTACAMGRHVTLVPVPSCVLVGVGYMLGASASVRRLCGFLQVDIDRARRLLDWKAPISLDEGLLRAVQRRRH